MIHEASILRVTNTYRVGQAIKPGFGVIPTLVNALRTGDSFKIFGSGNMQRDYVNVVDVQRAIAAAIDAGGAGVVNIGTGRGTSINELIAEVQELSGRTLNVEYVEADKNEPTYYQLDISRAENALGWKPTVSLREGLTQILGMADLL
ncbi:GDP-mannose 4,6-dehydratase [Antarcticimicrobium luteum]|uniref:GDP-mannose 4,6-dehydratase n=1 Tax=Antarcticimicrobium luteum TaxID=2547397 RepID=UPI00140DD287|nr:GDP-mannose 4,6-dehydratase [Antarcticimicrobium luteum]